MRKELTERGAEIDVLRNDGFLGYVKNGKTSDECDCDFCLYLDKDKYLPRILEKRGVKLFNSADAVEACDDKMLTHILLANKGIDMPTTLPAPLCYDPQAQIDTRSLERAQRLLGFPIVVKHAFGSLGKGVFKADDFAQLQRYAEECKLIPHLYQQFISSSQGRDMRVIVVGGKALGAIERQSNGDFRSNIGLGGKATAVPLSREIADIACRAADALGLDYCGIDFLYADRPLLCEVNSNAYFDAFESATGINVAAEYARHIINTVCGIHGAE